MKSIKRHIGDKLAVFFNWKSNEEASEYEEFYKLVTENIDDVLWIYNIKKDKFTYVSPSIFKLIGITQKEALKAPITDKHSHESLLYDQKILPESIAAYEAGDQSQRYQRHELEQVHKNGTYIPTEVITTLIKDTTGKVTTIIGITRDNSERKIIEQKKNEFEHNYRLLFNNMTNGFVYFKAITDATGKPIDLKVITMNPSFEVMFGIDFKPDASNLFTTLMPSSNHDLIHIFGRVAVTGFPKKLEVISKEYEKHYMVYSFSHRPGHCAVLFNDITPLKKVEHELRLSEEKFEKAFRLSPDAMIIQNLADWTIIDVNENFNGLTGYTAEESIGQTTVGLNLWETLADRTIHVDEINEKSSAISKEYTFKMKSGEKRVGLVSSGVITISNKPYLLSIIRDITERKRAEETLKRQNEEYFALNNELAESYQQLLRMNEELTIAKEKAQESDRLKTMFLNNLSHEIRTPMNAIVGFSELMLSSIDDKEKLVNYTEIINDRSNDLLDIIMDILEISKIDSEQIPVHHEVTNLAEVANEILHFVKIHQKKLEKEHILFDIQPLTSTNLTVIMTDKVKLKQIFIYLIHNAFKFTEKGLITVGCQGYTENTITFYIKDTGIGIEEENIPHIFERFRQLEVGNSRLYGGTGLGLAIVDGLLNLLGGTISVVSKLDSGSTFAFTIPYQKTQKNSIQKPVPNDINLSVFKGKQMLIIENETYNAVYLKEILNIEGLTVTHIETGNAAIDLMKAGNKFDIVILDIRFPSMEGCIVTQEIKKLQPQIKIIAQSFHTSSAYKAKAIEFGCSDYITKPIKREALLASVYNLLNN